MRFLLYPVLLATFLGGAAAHAQPSVAVLLAQAGPFETRWVSHRPILEPVSLYPSTWVGRLMKSVAEDFAPPTPSADLSYPLGGQSLAQGFALEIFGHVRTTGGNTLRWGCGVSLGDESSIPMPTASLLYRLF